MAKSDFDYKKAKNELDEILVWYESGENDIDLAIAKYKRAEELLNQLNDYLSDANAKIEKLIKSN